MFNFAQWLEKKGRPPGEADGPDNGAELELLPPQAVLRGLDLKAGVEQSLDDDFSRVFGVKDLRWKVGAAEKVGQHVLRGELAHAAPPSSLALADRID